MPAEDTPRAAAPPRSTAAFLRRSLETMRQGAPDRYGEIAAHLRRAPGRYAVGDERFTVAVEGERVGVRGGWKGPFRSVVETTPPAVLALFDGTATLEQLLGDESVVVRAGADALLDLSAAVGLFATEAVATTAYSRQFEEYREWVMAR